MNNFDFLKSEPRLGALAQQFVQAEALLAESTILSTQAVYKCADLAVRWFYAANKNVFKLPFKRDNFAALIFNADFTERLPEEVQDGLVYINKLGSYVTVHPKAEVTRPEAALALRSLFDFAMFLSYTYGESYTARAYNESELPTPKQTKYPKGATLSVSDTLFEKLSQDIDVYNQSLDTIDAGVLAALEAQRDNNTKTRTAAFKPISEAKTRKLYTDIDLKSMGWVFKQNCIEEYPVVGMPIESGDGRVDYVLFGDNGKPLAVVEAKRTTKDPNVGRTQAQLYANCLENSYGQRPLIFYTNGYRTWFWDDTNYPPRKVYSVFSKEDLQWIVDRRTMRVPFGNNKLSINPDITDRCYQKEAIQAVCTEFQKKHRKTLLVMATGTGKTRTAASLVDVLTTYNWATNILFLADRRELVKQAKDTFKRFLPNLSSCNLSDRGNDKPSHRAIFSTYPTIMNAINEDKTDKGEKLFTPSHFQLIIVDEAHRSIFNKYRAIFAYFDALVVGLTATPKDEVDRNTYSFFDLQPDMPTFAYEYQTAVHEKHLVDYHCIETIYKIPTDGIHRAELTDEEQLRFDGFFEEDEECPDDIAGEEINKIYFNEDTTRQVLNDLMTRGLKIEGNDKLGKTIIFAKNHRHAEFISTQFNALYPQYSGNFARVIDNYERYSEKLLTDFKDKDKYPQIAISVDMLDTGIDVPEILNLVFFKTVQSKIKFWQMIGRGTRLCEDVFGAGQNKSQFYIFDVLGNFEFFRENQNGIDPTEPRSLTEVIFSHKVRLIKELQEMKYQTPELIPFRDGLIDEITAQVAALNREHFHIRLELERVEKYSDKSGFICLGEIKTEEIIGSLSRLIYPSDTDDESARRLDALLYRLELAYLGNNDGDKNIIAAKIKAAAQSLEQKATIPQVREKRETIAKVQQDSFWATATILDVDSVRQDLRSLMQYLKKEFKTKVINMSDTVIFSQEGERLPSDETLETYYQRAERYITDNANKTAIAKLKNNDPLVEADWEELERVFWHEVGSEDEYRASFADTPYAQSHGGELPLGKFIRSITGLSEEAAQHVFSEFLDERLYTAEQIFFVKCVMEKIIYEGTLEKEELRNDEFTSRVSWLDAFDERKDILQRILHTIDKVNANALRRVA
jgi:type I restriction enzyme R subunit